MNWNKINKNNLPEFEVIATNQSKTILIVGYLEIIKQDVYCVDSDDNKLKVSKYIKARDLKDLPDEI